MTSLPGRIIGVCADVVLTILFGAAEDVDRPNTDPATCPTCHRPVAA